MTSNYTRRSFLKHSAALAGAAPLVGALRSAEANDARAPLVAYVGTFSSPLQDMLPTQVDLPPGNGRGIHVFHVDRGHRRDDEPPASTRWAPARAAWR